MAELKCGVETCTYNKDKYCCKGDIMVGGRQAQQSQDTCCESFRGMGGERFTSALEHPSKTISIDCEAEKCVYNSNYKCYAENVKIGGSHAGDSKETVCETFKER